MNAIPLQINYLILIFVTLQSILFAQNAVILQNSARDDLSEEALAESAGERSQPFGKISGNVTDMDTGQPLIGTNIVVVGKAMGAATNVDGQYTIERLQPGEYILEFSYIGYQPKEVQNVEINSDKTLHLDVKLKAADLKLSKS